MDFDKIGEGKWKINHENIESETGDIVWHDLFGGKTKIIVQKRRSFGLSDTFVRKYSMALGEKTEAIIEEENTTFREECQRLKEANTQLREVERINVQKEKSRLRSVKSENKKRVNSSQDEHGSNLENESELHRQEQLKRI